jgi:hypothetical protein
MEKKHDINDFLKKESEQSTEHIKKYLADNGIYELDKNGQLITTAKLISKIPWGEARTIDELLITKKYGTCTAKHTALKACFDELGIKSKQITSTFKWGEQDILYPENLRQILIEGEWNHGHNFLQVEKEDGTKVDVDVTWNPALQEFGFLTLPENWDGKTSFLGLNINARWDDVDMKKKKIELIESLSPELRERRERFLKIFVEWMHTINKI